MTVLNRTDEQRLAGAPFEISIGGKPRELRPLPRSKSKVWQKFLAETILRFSGLPLSLTTGKFDGDAIKEIATALIVKAPDDIAAIVYKYITLADPATSADKLEAEISDEEVAGAFIRMAEIAFPFYLQKTTREAGLGFLKWIMAELGVSLKRPNTNGDSDGKTLKDGPTNASG